MKQKIIFITLFILAILLCLYFSFRPTTLKEYTKDFFAMDTYITVKIHHSSKEKATKALEEIEKLYMKYQAWTNRYDTESTLYEIAHTNSSEKTIEIPKEVYELLEYGKNWYEKSNHLLNINMGSVIDVWKKYRDQGTGIPTEQELKKAGNTDIEALQLLENYRIKNNQPNIDLGAFAKGYVTELAGDYLNDHSIPHFLINAGGNVLVGKHYQKGTYKVGIQSPDQNGGLMMTLKISDKAIVTSGGYERNYEYQGVTYHHIIDPTTKFPPRYMKSVTVISSSSKEADALSTTLFLMSIEDGLEYIKNYPEVDVIWYSNQNEIIKTEGISRYE